MTHPDLREVGNVLTCDCVNIINDRGRDVGRNCALQPVLFHFGTVCRHFFPHICNLIGCEGFAVGQCHAHNEEFVFVHRKKLLAFLNHHVDVGRSHGRKRARRRAHAELVRSRRFHLKSTER